MLEPTILSNICLTTEALGPEQIENMKRNTETLELLGQLNTDTRDVAHHDAATELLE